MKTPIEVLKNGINEEANRSSEDQDELEEGNNPEDSAVGPAKSCLCKLATFNVIKQCNQKFSENDISAMRNKRKKQFQQWGIYERIMQNKVINITS